MGLGRGLRWGARRTAGRGGAPQPPRGTWACFKVLPSTVGLVTGFSSTAGPGASTPPPLTPQGRPLWPLRLPRATVCSPSSTLHGGREIPQATGSGGIYRN